MGKALINHQLMCILHTMAFSCLALAGCATTAPIGNPREVWCDHNQPRRPSLAVITAMTRAELDEMNAFNGQGAKWCGWKANA